MKVFISVDMEGATGVVHRDQLTPQGKTYEAARRLLTNDVNAAIEGVLEVEPSAEFRVCDGHGVMRNIVLEELHERAELVMGGATFKNRSLCQCEGIDDSYDLGLLVGFHSRAGTDRGLLAHTLVGMNICNFRINGEVVGEIAINATVMGAFGVPVGLVVGNNELEPEARDTMSGNFVFVSTKESLGPTGAICYSLRRTDKAIREGAKDAVTRLREGSLQLHQPSLPITMEVETYRREMTDQAVRVEGIERSGERSFSASGDSAPEVYSRIWHGIVRSLDQEAPWLQ